MREQLIRSLVGWTFEPHNLSSDELLASTLILFEALFRIEGMVEDCGVTPGEFIHMHHHLLGLNLISVL